MITRFFFLSMLFVAPALQAQTDWPQFRGPTGQGIAEARGLPIDFGEGKQVVWKTEIHGKAWSSPVIMGDQIWMTTATEKGDKLSAICVDKNSGKIVHDLLLFEVPTPQFAHSFNSYGSPTPTVQDGRVYVSFGSPGIACLDAKTGEKIWERRDFVCNHFRGAGSSPMLYKDLLILHFDGSDFQYVAAVNKHDGKTVWKTNRSIDFKDLTPQGTPQGDGDWRKAFSTPRVVTMEGQNLLLSLGSKCFYVYDPDTGTERWRAEFRDNHSGSATPVVSNGLIITCMGMGGNQLWAVKPGGAGVIDESHIAWRIKRNVPGRPSVLPVDDLLYFVDDGGMASCVEAANGKEVWRERLKGNFSASPIFADGKIYFCSEEGVVTVIEPGRELKVLATNKFDAGFMASPAVSDNALYLRSRTHLYRMQQALK